MTEDASKKKYYACSMLPYPSGKLHMGHVRNYTINDMLTRYLRMSGYNVLMPMGWDAFGLPAENAALKNGVPPAKWTYENIAYMKGQLQAMGLAIDWSREIATCDPSYYKWNQWLFLKMLEKGIAYRKTQVVNWDPVDQTVLANEQVIDGKGWRTGATVEKREIPGYYLKISDYAEELLDHTQHKLPGWPERVQADAGELDRQERGRALRLPARHQGRARASSIQGGRMYVFTTRADTIMGVTFCAVAPEHPLAAACREAQPQGRRLHRGMQERRHHRGRAGDAGEEGRAHRPASCTHPITDEPVPVWVGNYVLMGYGDGAVMGVPAHDERDFAFANKYGIEIIQVVLVDDEPHFDYHRWQDWYADKERGVTINSDNFSGMSLRRGGQGGGACAGPEGPGRDADHLAPARLGREPPALLGHADPDHPLRRARRGAGAREGPAGGAAAPTACPTARAIRCTSTKASMPAWSARSAASPRGARPTPWTPSSTAPGTSCATAIRRTTRPWWPRAPSTGCRWTSTSAASSMRSCTCSTRASGPR